MSAEESRAEALARIQAQHPILRPPADAGAPTATEENGQTQRDAPGTTNASWSSLANWDAAPSAPPPPVRKPSAAPQALGLRPPECADPACMDPMCGPMERMSEGPRPADLDPDKNRLQQAMLGLAKDNKADEIRELIRSQGLSAAYGNQIGQTALHVAGIWNAVEAGEVLIELGAEVDARNDMSGATPLHMAATRDRVEFCALLLARGADPGIEDTGGRIAADMVTPGTKLEELLRLPKGSPDAGLVLQDAVQAEQVKQRLELKELGNAAFKQKKYKDALRCYRQALEFAAPGEMEDKELETTLYSNSAECYIRLREPEQAIVMAKNALAVNPDHAKSLNRLQRASAKLKE